MPSINFVLPHWLYWLGLIVFPLIAMFLARRSIKGDQDNRHSLGTAYFVWLVGGFLGLHRLYLRNNWGIIYWPLFAFILYASSVERDARVVYSDARAQLELVDSSIDRKEKYINRSKTSIGKAENRLKDLVEGDRSFARIQRKITKENKKIDKYQSDIIQIQSEAPGFKKSLEDADQTRNQWNAAALYALFVVLALLILDCILLPRLLRKADIDLAKHPEEIMDQETLADDAAMIGTGFGGLIDRISLFSGEYVAFWSIIAVFVYYYEVIVRYVFNSPTNWAHESMFLMFGMQYLVAGAYAMLTESHVRVDIFYAKMPPRGKAFVDLLTSVFFFIFAGTLLVTSYIFSRDAIGQNEVSFTEWAVHYWPIKCVMVVGSILLIMQGISVVLKDISILTKTSPGNGEAH